MINKETPYSTHMHRIHAHCTCIARTAALVARTGTHCHAHFTMPKSVGVSKGTDTSLIPELGLSSSFFPSRMPTLY